MEPFDITWPGSTDRITISSIPREYEEIDAAAEYLAARMGPGYFPPVQHAFGGPPMSRNQRTAWRARLGNVFIERGHVLVARHTSSAGGVIAVAAAEPVVDEGRSRLVVQTTGGYEAETVDPVMRAALARLCDQAGYPLRDEEG